MTDPSPVPVSARTRNPTVLWICAGLAVALLLAVGFVMVLAAVTSDDGESAMSDASELTCSRIDDHTYKARLTVHNTSDQMRDYTITVKFQRSDGSQITRASSTIRELDAKGVRVLEFTTAIRNPELLFGCEVVAVQRF